MSDRENDPSEAELRARLDRLKSALARETEDAANAESTRPVGPSRETAAGLAAGLRVASEMVAGVLVGGVMGYTLDRLFSTSPWLLIGLTLMGFAAGLRNVYRLGARPTTPKQ